MPTERVKFFRGTGAQAADDVERLINTWLAAPGNSGYEILRTELGVAAVGTTEEADQIVVSTVWYEDKGGADVRRSRARIIDA